MSVQGDTSPSTGEPQTDTVDTHATDDDRPSAGAHLLAAVRRGARRCLVRWRSIVATTIVAAAVGVAVGVFIVVYRPDQRVGDAAAHRAIQDASNGAVAVLSYSYEHLHRALATAKSHLTSDFLAYYTKFTDNVLGPTAQQGQLTTTAKVVSVAVLVLHPDSAVVLVFVDQITSSKRNRNPQ
ncbi:hypothetical protein [Mycobacterium tilburgii]|uniref:hypothetical protein n=1 Tax=Mycobacterium tilburgii TaxID=44467 RepID=UPI001182345B|nr:hypothetical protein [Mycobacterium tilburgii]